MYIYIYIRIFLYIHTLYKYSNGKPATKHIPLQCSDSSLPEITAVEHCSPPPFRCVLVSSYIHIYIHTDIYTYTHTCIYIYINVHIYTYICV